VNIRSLGIGAVAVFLCALLALAADALLGWLNIREICRNEDQVFHTYEVMTTLEKTLALLEDAETGERGYVITGQRVYLEPYNNAVADLDAQMRHLRELVADNPRQRERVALLEGHVATELDELRKTIALREPAGFEAAQAETMTGRAKQAMDASRSYIADIEKDESEQLQASRAGTRTGWRNANWSFTIATLVALALLLLSYWLADREAAQRQRAADVAAENARLKDEFLAMLGHELRNPLAPLRTGLEVLRNPQLEEPDRKQVFAVLDRQMQHLERVLDDLLDVSRITSGRIPMRPVPVELAEIVARAVETVGPQIQRRRQELTVTLPPETVRLHADPARLVQVVTNLLGNSSKFTPEHGHIWLTAERDARGLTLRVRDTGVGIESTLLPFVFDLFRQGPRTLDRSTGGLGIGLTLVRRIVELHGGTVSAHSAGAGKGAEFVVWLPVPGKPVEGEQRPVHQEKGDEPRRRILVVDDNADAAETLAKLLRGAGHDVRTAFDGSSALEVFSGFHPEVMFLDIGMPGMDGYEVARRLRQQEGKGDLILVAVTGYGQDEDRRRSLEAGFDEHLIKPVDPEALHEVLARAA
jgi:signal transduction histidine kinase